MGRPKKTLKKTVALHIEDYQAFEILYNSYIEEEVRREGQGYWDIPLYVAAPKDHIKLGDEEWGTVASVSCSFGWGSWNHSDNGPLCHTYSQPTLVIEIEKLNTYNKRDMPVYLSTNVSFKLNNV